LRGDRLGFDSAASLTHPTLCGCHLYSTLGRYGLGLVLVLRPFDLISIHHSSISSPTSSCTSRHGLGGFRLHTDLRGRRSYSGRCCWLLEGGELLVQLSVDISVQLV
jgi:hypothetical protein